MNYYDTLDMAARRRHLIGLQTEAERIHSTIVATVGQECTEALDAVEANSREMAGLLDAMRRAGEPTD